MDTPVAWELVAKPWSDGMSEVDDFGEYWRRFRLARGYSLESSPDPLMDGFLNCLSWYFGECVWFSGTLNKPEDKDTTAYRTSVEQLFQDWYPMFCEDYARAIGRADAELAARRAAGTGRASPDEIPPRSRER
ncbi:hypothetical protein EES43_03015 [Streptomyces sp. ADI96-02]|uniref:hypothetical protein n=1 Tax=unclassified Streptomyces TaxID=2593676 RepID=UPI000F551604|nr:hypothetical protein [Streptomyces sp. ADI96-02]RPK67530.1 hypothetical protein EES43_03015 [Streptomyces sp. ADI96-02]